MSTLLVLSPSANWGAVGRIAEQVGILAQSKGWIVYLVYGRYITSSSLNLIRVGSKLSPIFHYTEAKLFDREGLGSRIETLHLIRKIKQIQPDIIHIHNIHDHWLNYRILFEYLNHTNIQVVWTFHDCWAFTGHCCHFVEVDCMKWKSQCGECPMKGRFRDGSAQNFLLKKSLFQGCKNLTIVPCSDWMGNFVKESFLKGKRIQVIHNGIDLDVFKTIITPGNDGKFRILAVSNVWSQSKGLYDIYRLRELLPLDSYEITMVGLTTQQVKNLPSGISGIQRTQNVQELVKLYAQSDVFINTTYADTFPTVNLEALACGTPVITYRTGGSPEAVTPETGKVVEQGNIQGMADAILSLQSQPLSRFACRQRAEQYFDKNKNFEQYIQLYESLLDKQ